MNSKDAPVRNRTAEPTSRSAARRGEWLLEAVRHLFVEAMADRRG